MVGSPDHVFMCVPMHLGPKVVTLQASSFGRNVFPPRSGDGSIRGGLTQLGGAIGQSPRCDLGLSEPTWNSQCVYMQKLPILTLWMAPKDGGWGWYLLSPPGTWAVTLLWKGSSFMFGVCQLLVS